MTETVFYSRDGHIGRLVLNNPERHNALGLQQLQAMQGYLDAVAEDPEIRVLIVTGNGEKTFCAGAALDELGEGRMGDDAFQVMTRQVADLAVPTLCVLNGNVYGGGVELAVSCDFRIGIEGCRMRVPAAAIGLCYPLEGINRFLESLGPALTRRILVASEEFDDAQLLSTGIVDHLVPGDALEDYASEFAHHIAGLAPLAVQSMKGILRQAARGSVDPDDARERIALCLQSQDLQEGFAAKRERRAPRFTGR
jgi:enoyl-CoA hydratase/carnithine racemase